MKILTFLNTPSFEEPIFYFQYPDNPTRQQKKDVKELVFSLLVSLVINIKISYILPYETMMPDL
jgi:hypothetical protein